MKTNEYRQKVGEIIKQQRKAANLTIYELSAASGISTSHLSRIENENRFPSASVLRNIAGPLGLGEKEILKLAGYLTSDVEMDSVNSLPVDHTTIDPYVARVLAQEPIEIQRVVIGIMTAMKALASNYASVWRE